MHLILSPHPDDAVLSLGACMSAWVRAGEPVRVLTVFDGGSDGALTQAAIEDRTRYTEDPVLLRKGEDATASKLFGFELISADMPELVYRLRRDGSARCQSLEDIYGSLIDDDDDVITEVANFISGHFKNAVVHIPLATGGHSDHRIVRAAAERVGKPLGYYDDLPYAIRLQTHDANISWPSINNEDVEKWIAGIKIYASQIDNLFEGNRDWPNDFIEWAAKASHVPGPRLR